MTLIANVSDIIKIMESVAPSGFSESWDNTGLQIGDPSQPVKKIQLSLDPTLDIIKAACAKGIDLLITHHPLFFSSLKTIRFDSVPGQIVKLCCENNLSVFSAHTNLDIATGGVNDVLSKKIGLEDLSVLHVTGDVNASSDELYKLVVFTPTENKNVILNAFFESGAGIIGDYSCCTFHSKGIGSYRPNENATPYAGKVGEVSFADEMRIESVLKKNDISRVVDFIRTHHPYEEMAYDVYPLYNDKKSVGIGRIGKLGKTIRLKDFAAEIKNIFELQAVRVVGNENKMVQTVAVCSGSGGSLIPSYLKSGADVYISGDLKYHEAKLIEDEDRAVIDIGHFHSEHIVLTDLESRLRKVFQREKLDVTIESSDLEKDPFKYF